MARLSAFIAAGVLTLAAAGAAQAAAAPNPDMTFTPFHANGIYAVGERAGWTVRSPLGLNPNKWTYEIRENNATVVKTGALDLSHGLATIETQLDHPGMLYVRLSPVLAGGPDPQPTAAELAQINQRLRAVVAEKDPTLSPLFERYPGLSLAAATPAPPTPAELDRLTVAAAIAPTQLKPADPRPADFDAFWAGKLAALKQVPINPKLVPGQSPVSGVEFSTVTLDSLGSKVHGYLAKPNRPGKFPALVIYQYAGVYPLFPETAANRAAEGWLTFNVDSHDMEPTEATAPRNYAQVGNTDRETSYFLAMYLRDTRALDYIESRPDWDGRTIVVMGTSMGGQQSLVTAGLNPDRVDALIVNVPSGTDFNGEMYGRREGYPNWAGDDPRVVQTGRYFDVINFAPKIRAASLVSFGFLDTTSPPAGIWTAFNLIQGPKEAVGLVESDHNHITPQKMDRYYKRAREALDQLVKTGRFTPNPRWMAAAN